MECTHYQYRLLNINPPNIASTQPRYRACNRWGNALSGSLLAKGLSTQPRGRLCWPLGGAAGAETGVAVSLYCSKVPARVWCIAVVRSGALLAAAQHRFKTDAATPPASGEETRTNWSAFEGSAPHPPRA